MAKEFAEVRPVTCKRIGGGYWLAITSENGRKVSGMADSETEARRRCSYLSHRLAWKMRREPMEDALLVSLGGIILSGLTPGAVLSGEIRL